MAITSTHIASNMIIYVAKDTGTGTVAHKYADVKIAATDADVYDVVNGTNGMAKLQSKTFAGVQRTNVIEIENA